MLAIIHALVGGLIGEGFHSLIFIALASFILHFVFDMIPHWDVNWDKTKFEKTGKAELTKFAKAWFIIDMILAIILITSLYGVFDNKKLILGAFMGILPDLFSLGYKTKLKNNNKFMKFLRFHSKIQRHTDWKKSMISQAVIISLLITIMFLID